MFTADVELWKKVLAWLYIITTNAILMFYVFLFGVQESSQRQTNWLTTFITWLVLEIFLINTLVVVLSNIYVPSMLMSDLKIVKERLLTTIEEYRSTVDKGILLAQSHEQFNAAKFFFVSTRIADVYPKSEMSKIICRFETPWPRKTYRKPSTLGKALSTTAVLLVQAALSMPPSLQDAVSKVTIVLIIGHLAILQAYLAEFGALIIVLPLIVLLVVLYYAVPCFMPRRRDNLKVSPKLQPPVTSSENTRRASVLKGLATLQQMGAKINNGSQDVPNRASDSPVVEHYDSDHQMTEDVVVESTYSDEDLSDFSDSYYSDESMYSGDIASEDSSSYADILSSDEASSLEASTHLGPDCEFVGRDMDPAIKAEFERRLLRFLEEGVLSDSAEEGEELVTTALPSVHPVGASLYRTEADRNPAFNEKWRRWVENEELSDFEDDNFITPNFRA